MTNIAQLQSRRDTFYWLETTYKLHTSYKLQAISRSPVINDDWSSDFSVNLRRGFPAFMVNSAVSLVRKHFTVDLAINMLTASSSRRRNRKGSDWR